MQNQAQKENQLPQWLEEQQRQSWQIEILIASGALFFLIKLPDFFKEYLLEAAQGTQLGSEFIILVVGGYMFSRALLIGFVINLILRALWLGLLGINFAFPKGIDFKKLQYSAYFHKKISATPSITERIIQLEKICSLSYSIAILITLMAVGIFLLLAVLFLFISYLAPAIDSPFYGYIFLILLVLMTLGIMDFLFFRLFRKSEIISKGYYPFYKLFGWLSLSFLYRKEWLTLISNVKPWKVYLLFAAYFLFALLITSNEMSNYVRFDYGLNLGLTESRKFSDLRNTFQAIRKNNYDNMLQANDKVASASLQAEVVKKGFVSFFVVYQKWFDPALERLFGRNKVVTDRDSLRRLKANALFANDSLIAKSLSNYFTVYIDRQKQEGPEWFFHQHPITEEKGFLTYLNIDTLAFGKHRMDLFLKVIQSDTLASGRYVSIPFFKE